MQRFKQPNMDLHPDGEWIRYSDHVEAMKRIAGEGGAEPVAHVPVHPRIGPLWMDVVPVGSDFQRSENYPQMALYATPALVAAPAVLTDEQRKALEAVIHDYEERGFNRMPRVLRSILATPPAAHKE